MPRFTKDLAIAVYIENKKLPKNNKMNVKQQNNLTAPKNVIYPMFAICDNTPVGKSIINIGNVKVGDFAADIQCKDRAEASMVETSLNERTCHNITDKKNKQASNENTEVANKDNTTDQTETHVYFPPKFPKNIFNERHGLSFGSNVDCVGVKVLDGNKVTQTVLQMVSQGESLSYVQQKLLMFPVTTNGNIEHVLECTENRNTLHSKKQQNDKRNIKPAPVYLVPNKHYLKSHMRTECIRKKNDLAAVDLAGVFQDNDSNQLGCILNDESQELLMSSVYFGAECEVTGAPIYSNTDADVFLNSKSVEKSCAKEEGRNVQDDENSKQTFSVQVKQEIEDNSIEEIPDCFSPDRTNSNKTLLSSNLIRNDQSKNCRQDANIKDSTDQHDKDDRLVHNRDVLDKKERIKTVQIFEVNENRPCILKRGLQTWSPSSEDESVKRMKMETLGKTDTVNTRVCSDNVSKKKVTIEISNSPSMEEMRDAKISLQNVYKISVPKSKQSKDPPFDFCRHDHPYNVLFKSWTCKSVKEALKRCKQLKQSYKTYAKSVTGN